MSGVRESLFASDVLAVETALDRIGYMAMTGGTTADNVEAIRVPAYRALRGIVVKHKSLVVDLAALEEDAADLRGLVINHHAAHRIEEMAAANIGDRCPLCRAFWAERGEG